MYNDKYLFIFDFRPLI